MNIRRANLNDCIALVALAREYFEVSGYADIATFSEGQTLRRIHEYISDPDSYLFVLDINQSIEGFCILTISNLYFAEKEARIEMFFCKKKGYGRIFAKYALEFAKSYDVCMISVDTYCTPFARVFSNMFKKLGFTETGVSLACLKK